MEIITDAAKFFIALISIINPIGATPIFLTLTSSYSIDEIKSIARSCSAAVFFTILVTLFFGQHILNFFGITVADFRVGGGILIAMNAMNMLRAQTSESKISKKEIARSKEDIAEIGIVPLGIPLLAGPGAISSTIIYSENFTRATEWVGAVIALLLLTTIIFLVLRFSRTISNRIGRLGVNIMTRIMGLILMALAVEFIAVGLKDLFPGLAG